VANNEAIATKTEALNACKNNMEMLTLSATKSQIAAASRRRDAETMYADVSASL